MLEAAIVTIFCQQHQATERVRVRIKYVKQEGCQPRYSRNMRDEGSHLKSLTIGRRTSEDSIIKVLREHFPDADNITLVQA